MPEPHLRAADADRAAVAGVLGEHMAAGRLTVAEYEERLARAYASKTYGELDELTTDLPPARTPALPASAPPAPATGAAKGAVSGWSWSAWGDSRAAAWAGWLSTGVLVTAIWLITCLASGEWLYPWPIWVVGPWGAVLLAQTLAEGREEPGGRRELPS